MPAPKPATSTDATRVVIPYNPRREQAAYHADRSRFKVLVAHRRLGKTVAAVNEGIKHTLSCPLPAAQGAYVAPFRNQAKRVAWAYVKMYTAPIPGVRYDEQDLTVRFPNGSKFSLYGGDNVHALRGVYLDHAVIDEPAQMHPLLWSQVLRPALSDRRGGATFIGTPNGKNVFWELYRDAPALPDWSRFLYTADKTQIIHPDELLALRREMDADSYRQEYLCDFDAAIRGAYWGAEMRAASEEGRIGAVPYDPQLEVHTAWDLGWSDATVVTYWQVSPGGQVRCIDCDAHQQTTLAGVVKVMREKPYLFSGEHALPHDVKVHELSSGASRFEVLWDLGLRGQVTPKLSHMDGVQAVRSMLARTWFDAGRCAVLVEALKQYRAEYDERGRVMRAAPLRDWTWDFADSVRYFAISPPSRGRQFGRQSDLLERLNADLDRSAV